MKKTYSLSAFDLINFLDEVRTVSQELRDKIISASLEAGELTVYLNGEVTAQDESDLDAFIVSHNPDPVPGYRIMPLLNQDFHGLPIENIDFKRHLKGPVALDKSVVMLANGRPDMARYLYQGVVYAEIRFEFQDINSLMIDKRKKLLYLREDGSYGPEILIEHRTYDHSSPVDGAVVIAERIDARTSIVGGMKAFLSGVVMQAWSQSISEVIETITPFWDDCETQRLKFIEFGKSDWSEYMVAIDMSTTQFTYLSFPIDQEGTTIRDYMVSRINY